MAQTVIKKHRNLTEGPILPKLLMFALPLIATSILQYLFNTADIVVVGRWGGSTPEESETALAAVGACGSLLSLFINFFMGISVGAGVCAAHDIGARKHSEVQKTVHTSIVISLICGVAIMVFGILFARPLLQAVNTQGAVLEAAVPYICAYFCGIPAHMLYNYCAAILRSDGDTVRPLTFLSVAGVVNVLLNLLMVCVFRAGALGVGVATAASHWTAATMIVIYMMRMDGYCKIEWKKIGVDFPKMRRMIAIGLPAGIQSSFFAISNVLIQSSVNSFGQAVIAGNTAATNLENYIYATQHSMQQAALTFVGQHVGAGKYDRLKKCIFLIVSVTILFGVVFGWGIYLFGEPLLSIYIPNAGEATQTGMLRLSLTGTMYCFLGLLEIGSGILRSMGKSLQPMIITLIGTCAFRIVWIYTAFAKFQQLSLLYASYPISWVVTSLAQWVLVLFVFRKIARRKAQKI